MSKTRKIILDDSNTPRVGSSVYVVKEMDKIGHPEYPAYGIYPEIVVESRLKNPEDPSDPINFDEVLIKVNVNGEWKTISTKRTTGHRKINEIISSEEETIATFRHYNEQSKKDIDKEILKMKEKAKNLQQIVDCSKDLTELNFDKPGEPIKFKVFGSDGERLEISEIEIEDHLE